MQPLDTNFPVLSGSFDSPELTENQRKLVGIVKALGKMATVVSESQAKIRVEKVGGLESFMYQLGKLQDEGKLNDREQIEKLEQEVRFEDKTVTIGNKTESFRFLLHQAQDNPIFKQLTDEVIKEQLDLERKTAEQREIAEATQSSTFEN